MEASLFERLCQRLNARPDRRGEVHVNCPFCGKEAKRGQVHFSFSERGAKCLVCGESAGLRRLAEVYGLDGAQAWTPPTPRAEAPRRTLDRSADFARWCDEWARNPRAVDAWQKYKPLPEQVIRAHRLGLGRFPKYASQCQHERLMVPLYQDGKVVGIRGRALDCEHDKWLSPAGSKCALYNAEHLGRAAGRVVWIVENPIDALLLELALPDAVAVATLGVSMWQEEWTGRIAQARPASVIVAYDNDRPGNGGGETGRAVWLATHPKDLLPNGVKLANRLLAAGVRARLFPWPADAPVHMDIGDVLRGRIEIGG